MKKKHKKLISAIIAILIVLLYNYYTKDIEPSNANKENIPVINEVTSDLQIYYFDVGQADSILILNNDTAMLIDAGNNADGPLLVDYIKNKLKINKIDIVVGTHPHEDHIGGIDDIINNFDIEDIYLPEVITTTKTFEDMITAIENKDLAISIPEIGEKFKLGEADFEVIYTGTDDKDLNATSIIINMLYGEKTYLFTGDTTEEVEDTILNKNIDIDVLKVAHHGSRYSSSYEFLKIATPEYAIVSVGEENSYEHPHQEAINRIKKHTNNIYMTKDVGTILLTSDGKEIEIEYLNTNTNG
jgi:competence protein ComEC